MQHPPPRPSPRTPRRIDVELFALCSQPRRIYLEFNELLLPTGASKTDSPRPPLALLGP